jgi:hypothetical protein
MQQIYSSLRIQNNHDLKASRILKAGTENTMLDFDDLALGRISYDELVSDLRLTICDY